MKKSSKLSPEVRERAFRMVSEHRAEYPSQWAAVLAIAGKQGRPPQTLLNWYASTNATQASGLT